MASMNIQRLDLEHNWHPCSQMKDYETFRPLVIERAFDSYLQLLDGRKIIDATSSWWCKSLGHNHPVLKEALLKQINKFEHVIFANTTNETISKLSQKLCGLMPHLEKAFYAGDGSSAVEIAIKMSLHVRLLEGNTQRKKIVSLRNGYHGETIGALSVSDLGIYRLPYESVLFDHILVDPPYMMNKEEHCWNNANEYWLKTEKQLEAYKDSASAIIFEPILQGAGGMKLYSQDFLNKLAQWAKKNSIHLIADEIMTGFGRTGKMLASEHAKIEPDIVCLSKGLTSGWMPFSAVLTTDNIYQTFYDDYENGKSFLHSHTYSGNAMGASLALATMEVIEDENLCQRAMQLEDIMGNKMQDIANKTGLIQNIRGIGAVVAADLVPPGNMTRAGYLVYQEAIKLGALLRPLGNTIYWTPPLTTSNDTINELAEITQIAIQSVR